MAQTLRYKGQMYSVRVPPEAAGYGFKEKDGGKAELILAIPKEGETRDKAIERVAEHHKGVNFVKFDKTEYPGAPDFVPGHPGEIRIDLIEQGRDLVVTQEQNHLVSSLSTISKPENELLMDFWGQRVKDKLKH